MHKKFEINRTKIKGLCQPGRKVATHNSKSDLPLTIGSFKNEGGGYFSCQNFKKQNVDAKRKQNADLLVTKKKSWRKKTIVTKYSIRKVAGRLHTL